MSNKTSALLSPSPFFFFISQHSDSPYRHAQMGRCLLFKYNTKSSLNSTGRTFKVAYTTRAGQLAQSATWLLIVYRTFSGSPFVCQVTDLRQVRVTGRGRAGKDARQPAGHLFHRRPGPAEHVGRSRPLSVAAPGRLHHRNHPRVSLLGGLHANRSW